MFSIKKVFILFIAILVFAMPFHEEVKAVAVASKVVNASAKKIAKEIAVDTAVQMSMNMVLDYKYTPKDSSKTPKEGYSFVCMPRDKKPDGDCAKPVEVKTNLSSADKQSLATKVETNLDKKIAGGIGATRWGKFLDWFVPIFSIGMGVAVIDYAMDGDVSDLFDELGYDALVEMGLIVGSGTEYSEAVSENLVFYGSKTGYSYIAQARIVDGKTGTITLPWLPDSPQNLSSVRVDVDSGLDGFYGMWSLRGWEPIFIDNKKQMLKMPDFLGPAGPMTEAEAKTALKMSGILDMVKIDNFTPPESSTPTNWGDTALPRTNKENKPIKIPAPGSLPFKEEGTDLEVLPYPKPDGTTGFKTRTGTEVPPDKVSVGNPTIIENPNGDKTVVKAPTVTTPNPAPSENGTIPSPTGQDEPITEEELGNSCTRLKKPDFKPLTNAITTSFPFSIPWDLHNAFQNAFSGIGDDRPEFEYKGSYNGKTFEWKIEFPKFFDSWMPFIRGIMILSFDIGLLYAIYRFTKGGGD